MSESKNEEAPLADVLGAQEAAMARSRGYGFLADLVAGPLDAELYEQVVQVPQLADAARKADGGESYTRDELAAAHYELFGLQVFPFAGVFLNIDALAGGQRVSDMESRYRHWGFDSSSEEGADHLACQLRFMAHLSALELGARASADWERVAELQASARDFLDAHLLPWMLPLLCASSSVAAPLYSEVVTMAVFVASDHRRELGQSLSLAEPERGPDPQAMLASPKTSIRDIADYLLSPSRSGAWISRAEIQELGRGLDVPRGFGSRVQLLSNLLRNAAEYELGEEVLGGLETFLAREEASFTTISRELGEDAYATHWLERIVATRDTLLSIKAALPQAREAEEE